MTEQQGIADELAATIHENFNACRGRGGVSPNALAQVILASPVIRRIQAETLREAADALSGDMSNLNPANPLELAYINCTLIDAQELRHRADRIERGDR